MQQETSIVSFTMDDGKAKTLMFSADREDIGNIIQLAPDVLNGRRFKQWGSKNDLPEYREDMLMDSNIMGELIDTKRNIALGNGMKAYHEIIEDGVRRRIDVKIPGEIADWLRESEFYENYLDAAFLQWYMHANVFAEFVLTKKGTVHSVQLKNCRYIRAVEKINGKIPGYIYAPKWGSAKELRELKKSEWIPAYNPERKQAKFMLHIADNVFHDGYYGIPAYWGGVEWIRVSNSIPVFHESNLKNGYNIRFLVKYPEGYFLNKYEYDTAAGDPDKQQECLDKERIAKQDFIDKINELLSGSENAGRAVFVEDMLNQITSEYTGVTITPVDFDMKDKALLELYEKTNQANISAQGIHPTLANIESQGKLSSGSEMRNAFLFYVLTKVPRPRRQVLKTMDVVMKINGWDKKYPDLKWTFQDFQITTLDDEKNGYKPVNNADDDGAGI